MIPACRPQNSSGAWRVFPVSATGKVAWVDYIPVKNVDGDQHWDNVGSMLLMNTGDNDDEKDESAWSTFNSPGGATTVPGYTGDGYLDLNGTNQWARRAAVADLFAGDFTIEARIYPTALTYRGIFGARANVPGSGGWSLIVNDSNDKLCLSANVNASYDDFFLEGVQCTVNAWQHVAVTREDDFFRMWQEGEMTGEVEQAGAFVTDASFISLGSVFSNTGQFFFAGYIDWIRITAAARYSAAFTAPLTEPATAAGLVPVSSRERHENDGAIAVEVLSSVSGLTLNVDYTQVVLVEDDDAGRWRTASGGFIPIRPV